jgi:hypothetical protein
MKKQVEIAGREVRTVRRMVQYIPLDFFFFFWFRIGPQQANLYYKNVQIL